MSGLSLLLLMAVMVVLFFGSALLVGLFHDWFKWKLPSVYMRLKDVSLFSFITIAVGVYSMTSFVLPLILFFKGEFPEFKWYEWIFVIPVMIYGLLFTIILTSYILGNILIVFTKIFKSKNKGT